MQTTEFKILSKLPGTEVSTRSFCKVLQFEDLGLEHSYFFFPSLQFTQDSIQKAVQERLYTIRSDYVSVMMQVLNYYKLKNNGVASTAAAWPTGGSGALECPLCVEDFSGEPVVPVPCRCQYWVCPKCVDRLLQQQDSKCPHCRAPYDPTKFMDISPQDILASKREKSGGPDAVSSAFVSNMLEDVVNSQISWNGDFRVDREGRIYATSCETFVQWQSIVQRYETIYENFCCIWKLITNETQQGRFFQREMYKSAMIVCLMHFEKYWVELADMRKEHPQLPGFRVMTFFWDNVRHKLRDCLHQAETRGRKRERDLLRAMHSETHAGTVVGADERKSKQRST